MEGKKIAGSIVGKIKGSTTIRAKVFEYEGGPLLEDLGVIVGKRTKEEEKKTKAALARLAKNYKGEKHAS